ASQQAGGPTGAATQVEHALAGAQVHEANGLLGDVEVMAFHLLAAARLGPAIEFFAQNLVGGWSRFHATFPYCQGRWPPDQARRSYKLIAFAFRNSATRSYHAF